MGSERFRSIFCGPNYVSPASIGRVSRSHRASLVYNMYVFHVHGASKSIRLEHHRSFTRRLYDAAVTAKRHKREMKFTRTRRD